MNKTLLVHSLSLVLLNDRLVSSFVAGPVV